MAKKNNRGLFFGDDQQSFEDAVAPESDRACVLVASEFISHLLGELLHGHMTNLGFSKKLQEEMLDHPTAPLGTFAMRIRFARLCGLNWHDLYGALEAIRQMRNHCAHHSGQVHLADKAVSGQIGVLNEFFKKYREPWPLRAYRIEKIGGPPIEMTLDETWIASGADPATYSSQRRIFMEASSLVFGLEAGLLIRVGRHEQLEHQVIGASPNPPTAPRKPQK